MSNSDELSFSLDHSVEIRIPSRCGDCSKNLPHEYRNSFLTEIKSQFPRWFGGCGVRSELGVYKMPDGTLVEEEIDVVYSNCTLEQLQEHVDDLKRSAARMAIELSQDSVALSLDGRMSFYDRPEGTSECLHEQLGASPAGTPERTPGGRPPESELEKLKALQAALDSLSSIDNAKYVFSELLNYDLTDEHLPTREWPKELTAKLVDPPQVVCYTRGFRIVHIRLKHEKLLRGWERELIARIMRDVGDPYYGLFIVSNEAQDLWELVNVKNKKDTKSTEILRRIPIGRMNGARTATERLALVDLENRPGDIPAIEIQRLHDQAFDVEQVTKEFYRKVADWYFWALQHPGTKYPRNVTTDAEKSIFFIRLLTRLIFCWFIREKGLIPRELFHRRYVEDMLKDSSPESGSFYKAFLQNLFFGTLNQEPDRRSFRKKNKGNRNGNRGATSLFRYADLLSDSEAFLDLLCKVPFVNGGLFDCLDKVYKKSEGRKDVRLDDFSEEKKNRLCVPNDLFLGPERVVDVSDGIGPPVTVRVGGLLRILNQYQFTIEENTPLDQAVALDPELLGKVFENLLASYSEETKIAAKKALGAFYTPREIVDYMVDESLIAHLQTALDEAYPKTQDIEKRLRSLFAYDEKPHGFTEVQVGTLIRAIDSLKALDPAVGSGAFPMGILHKLVFLLRKLDPGNERWKERQIERVREAMAAAGKIEAVTVRENTLRDLEQQITSVNDAFEHNELDYGRKLYLIENCIYGVDIQPIAVQIARMRFFISLIVDQKVDQEALNQGVRPLPNLETKFVAANSLISIDRHGQQHLCNQEVDQKQRDLRKVRERFFTARTPETKVKYRNQDAKLRQEIAKLLVSPKLSPALQPRFTKAMNIFRKAIRNVEKGPWNIETARTKLCPAIDKLSDTVTYLIEDSGASMPAGLLLEDLIKTLGGAENRLAKDTWTQVALVAFVKELLSASSSQAGELEHGTGLSPDEARKLAAWDPYDQNASASFFDPEWMFGVRNGFDVVIGNPPYVQIQSLPKHVKEKLQSQGFKTFQKTADLYCLFYEKGHQLLSMDGNLCFITSNQWMRTGYGEKMRRFFSQETNVKKLLDLGEGIFAATTNTNILLFEKNTPGNVFAATRILAEDNFGLCHEMPWISLAPTADPWLILSPLAQGVMCKMKKAGTPLRDWDMSINYGIKTGFGAGFIVDGSTRDKLGASDPDVSELIKPLVRGKDIKRYRINHEDTWLINTHNGYRNIPAVDINDYPSIRRYLDEIEQKRISGQLGEKARKAKGLLRRDDQGQTPYNLRSCAYIPDFEQENITWGNLAKSAQFALADAGVYINAPSPIITPANRYLLAVLNSRLADYFIRCLGVIRSGGFLEYKPMFVEKLPVPIIHANEQKPFADLADKILLLKKGNSDADASDLECKIDELVYELYGLTENEIKLVEEETQ